MNKLIIVQPAFPEYRKDFFFRVNQEFKGEMILFFSENSINYSRINSDYPCWAKKLDLVLDVGFVQWQRGVLSIELKEGDVLVVSGAPRCLSNILLILKAKIAGAKVVWWGHYMSSTSKWYRVFFRMLLMKMADKVIFYTDKEVLRYKAEFGKYDRRLIGALNNGLDFDRINKLRVSFDPYLRGDEILFIGRLTAKSQLLTLIKSLEIMNRSTVKLHVIGDGEYMNKSIELSKELGVFDRITFYKNVFDEIEISKIANKCKLFVYPGDVGLSVIHSFCYGLPVVVHNDINKHMPEIAAFDEGENGMCFDKNDPYSLAKSIEYLFGAPELLKKMSNKCLEKVANKFNTKEMAKRMINVVFD